MRTQYVLESCAQQLIPHCGMRRRCARVNFLYSHFIVSCHPVTCPNRCSGRGTCGPMTIGMLAPGLDPVIAAAYTNWDANVTYGCNCDFGFAGPDCSLGTSESGIALQSRCRRRAVCDQACAFSFGHRCVLSALCNFGDSGRTSNQYAYALTAYFGVSIGTVTSGTLRLLFNGHRSAAFTAVPTMVCRLHVL